MRCLRALTRPSSEASVGCWFSSLASGAEEGPSKCLKPGVALCVLEHEARGSAASPLSLLAEATQHACPGRDRLSPR